MKPDSSLDGGTDCTHCAVGAAAGLGRGGRCPLADRRRAAGTVLYAAGQRADRVWFVKRGAVLLSREATTDGSNGVAWAVRRSGVFVGIEGLTRTYYVDTAQALTDVILCSAEIEHFDAWLGPSGSAARVVLQLVLQAQSEDAPRGASCDGPAVQRTAQWILGHGAETETSVLPRQHAAQMLGMCPETFSRALTGLARRGAITRTRQRLRVLDRELLEQIARDSDSPRARGS